MIGAQAGVSELASDIRPWYRWHWHLYRTSSRVLALSGIAAHGAYHNLIDAMWEKGGTLSTDRNSLWRLALASCKQEYEGVADEVEAMFERSEDGLTFTNDRLTQEWNTTTEYLEKKRTAGGKGGQAKARNRALLLDSASKPLADASNALANAGKGLPISSSTSSSSTEDQNLDALDSQVVEIYRIHPKNATMVAAGRPCPSGQERLIAEAIVQDGYETVLCGTRNLADAFAKRPRGELRFCPSPDKFFSVSNPGYQTDPVFWQGETPKAMTAAATRDTAPRESPLDKMRRELASD